MFGFLNRARPRNDLETVDKIDSLRQRMERLEMSLRADVERLQNDLETSMEGETRRRAAWVNLEAEISDILERVTSQVKKLRQREYRARKAAENDEDGGEDPQLEMPHAPDAKISLYRKLGL